MVKTSLDSLVKTLQEGCRRALKLRLKGFPRPYYCSFLVRDSQWYLTWASHGASYQTKEEYNRWGYCDLRVGSYSYDQVSEGGLQDNDEEAESYSYTRLPTDESTERALAVALWKLSEIRFREALSAFNHKEAGRISHLNPTFNYSSFKKLSPLKKINAPKLSEVNISAWEEYCKKASAELAPKKDLVSSWVEFQAATELKIFVSTENRIIVQPVEVFSLSAKLSLLAKDGTPLHQELALNVGSQEELPSLQDFCTLLHERYKKLHLLKKARRIHSFSGPVLLYPKPSGLLFHEAIGHRLEGSRHLSKTEGNTFKGQEKNQVFPLPLNFEDNPKIKEFQGQKCIGAYDFDDEGSPAKSAKLIEKGRVNTFLTTRASISARGHSPNGHARNRRHERPVSRMAVSLVTAPNGKSIEELKQLLIEEIKLQRKPFGMIVYETSGGETETTSYDFQAFFGEISFATLLYPDGKEEVVRGVNFVGTPLQALHHIRAVGKELELDNSFCGAESGYIPVSTISPALLLSNLELQAKEEELIRPFLLPPP